MGHDASTLRLFVAVYPPAAVADALLRAAETLDLPDRRLLPPEQVHLTVQFVGETLKINLARVEESVGRSAAGLGAFTLHPMRLCTFPGRGPARLVAAETDAPPAVLELHRRLAQRLAHSPRERTGDRFLPHLTLLRFRSPAPRVRVDHPLDPNPFLVDSIALVASVLHPSGAEHREIARFTL